MKKFETKFEAGDVIVLSKDELIKNGGDADVHLIHGMQRSTWDHEFEGRVITLSKSHIAEIENCTCVNLEAVSSKRKYYVPVQSFRYDISHKLKLL